MKRIILFLFLFLVGCSSINQIEAEKIAKDFVNERVRFFSAEEDEKKGINQYSIGITSYEEEKDWVVVMHVESKVDNETKDNDLVVKINRKGDVMEFNGQKVEQVP
ncbi:MAG: hypothetical protein U9O94_02915 [Nanoarchaeota archaeon]|nr:hypothetical protein [Nanoarchaeota archaeon]